MTDTVKHASIDIGATDTVLYTCPIATQAVIHGLIIGNVHATEATRVKIQFFDAATSITHLIVANIPLPVGAAIELSTKFDLNVGDQLILTADASAHAGAFASVLEITA